MRDDRGDETCGADALEQLGAARSWLHRAKPDDRVRGSVRAQGHEVVIRANDRDTIDRTEIAIGPNEADDLDLAAGPNGIEDDPGVAAGADEQQTDHVANDTAPILSPP